MLQHLRCVPMHRQRRESVGDHHGDIVPAAVHRGQATQMRGRILAQAPAQVRTLQIGVPVHRRAVQQNAVLPALLQRCLQR